LRHVIGGCGMSADSWPKAQPPQRSGIKRGVDGEVVAVNGVFNYQSDSIKRSLVANGQIVTKRDGSGSDAELHGAIWEPKEVTVHNARSETALALDVHGFELRESPTTMLYGEFYEEDKILRNYYLECQELIKQVTGASIVVAFDHNLRSASGKKASSAIKGGSSVQNPATLVHGDYTLTSGPRRLEQLTLPPKANDTLGRLLGGPVVSQEALQMAKTVRFAIVNVWRSIRDEPVEVMPLACCDATTTEAEDLCVFEIHYADRIGENYFAAHSPSHQWYHYPRMVRNEALLLKQWDSQGKLAGEGGSKATFALHSAFYDPTASKAAPDRESIEVRCICIWEPPAEKEAMCDRQ